MHRSEPQKSQSAELEEFKKFLGPMLAKRYAEGQLHQLRREMYEMANLLLDLHLKKKADDKRSRKSRSSKNLTNAA